LDSDQDEDAYPLSEISFSFLKGSQIFNFTINEQARELPLFNFFFFNRMLAGNQG
jgi:hypothetical protein